MIFAQPWGQNANHNNEGFVHDSVNRPAAAQLFHESAVTYGRASSRARALLAAVKSGRNFSPCL